MARAVAVAVLLLLGSGVPAVFGAQGVEHSASRFIVQVASADDQAALVGTLKTHWGAAVGVRFNNVVNGFAAELTPGERRNLARDPRVTAIVPDVPVHAAGNPYPVTDAEIQPGIRRVGAMGNADRSAGNLDVDIAVLDTGIQPDNTELNIAGGYNCTDPDQPDNWADSAGFGHGTHVSGIAAAIENGSGVAGVAQGARLWAIKVLDGNGNGYWSWVICGLDRVAGMRDPNDPQIPTIEVVNMSIASIGSDDGDCGYSNADLLHQAVCRVNADGITMVAAAGNAHQDAAGIAPASYDEVITVAAMADWDGSVAGAGTPPVDCLRTEPDDAFGGFSDFGADVDLIAPGVCVLSLLPVDLLGLMTGTSMATPHVSGGAALYFAQEARAGRPRPTPEQVRAALIATGTIDWQTQTDPDISQPGSAREPALDVAHLEVAPGFRIGTRRQIVRAGPTQTVTNGLWLARLGGFNDPVDWSVDAGSLPPGSSTDVAAGQTLTVVLPSDAQPGSYDVRIIAVSNAQSESATFRLVVPAQGSDAGGPSIALPIGRQASQTTLPVDVSWPAVAGARKYRLEVSVDEGPWGSLVTTRKTRITTAVLPGRRYRYRVQDRVGGVWGAWRAGPGSFVSAIEPSAGVAFSGAWQVAPIKRGYSELPVFTTANGATATLDFTGRGVAWLATKGPDRGQASVYVDGNPVATVDLYAPAKANRIVVWSMTLPSAQTHELSVVVVGEPSTRPRVDIDALIVVAD